MTRRPLSLKRRLLLLLLGIAGLLSVVLYLTVRAVADRAAEATQDRLLGSATLAIAEQLRGGDDGVDFDLPYAAFSILGSMSEDRVFYRIDVGGETVTGYDDLPDPPRQVVATVAPIFYDSAYRDTEVRIAATVRTLLIDREPMTAQVFVAQTRQGQEAIAQRVANSAAVFGIGFFLLAALLSLLTAGSVLRPINQLAETVGRRGPQDLRAVAHPAPAELVPLITALNGFIARLRVALNRTETFITEAAHHIRTPLATVRARTEIALRQTEAEESRETLRAIIRAVEESARSATQLLDHATVVYRSDRLAEETVDLERIVRGVVAAFAPTAELKDVTLSIDGADAAATIKGDRLLLESALRNLLDNALKYSPPDSDISISVKRVDGRADILVCDHGRGLDGASLSDLSGRFKRGRNVGDIVGSGLGLTIVAEVASAHNGVFDLTQREGGGACARLSLPLQ